MQKAISIVIPAYNEEKSVGNVIEETIQVMDSLGCPYEIIVVDDGSTDGTYQAASKYKATVISYPINRGKGYAVRRGFERATGDIIVMIDSDGTHTPKEIPELVEPLFNGTDIVAGSRFLGSIGESTTMIHRVGNFFINTAIASLTGQRITDSQTGFRAIKREVIDRMHLNSTGFEIESEITIKSLKNGFRFKEKPITCQKRYYNVSRVKILRDGQRIFRTIIQSSMAKIEHEPSN